MNSRSVFILDSSVLDHQIRGICRNFSCSWCCYKKKIEHYFRFNDQGLKRMHLIRPAVHDAMIALGAMNSSRESKQFNQAYSAQLNSASN